MRTLTGADQGIPEITDAELEQIAPGTIRQVKETVDRHYPSDHMYLAMYAEVRDIAQTVVTHMDPEHREALLGALHKNKARPFRFARFPFPVSCSARWAMARSARAGVRSFS